jgi:predicted nucleic acid-binding protein
VPVRGTLGVVVLAKRRGVIDYVAPLFTQLMAAGMRIDDSVLQTALQQAGE